MIAHAHASSSKPNSFEVRILRQYAPGEPSQWERHRVTYEPELNVNSVLQRIAAQATTADGVSTTPVAWDANCLEEVCGSCTMLINGVTRQACSALVDRLLDESPEGIELRPMSKFPVLRDLCVDRRRMFQALERQQAWVEVDDYIDRGAGPRESQDQQGERYPLSECMSCGCCLEACPQYAKIEVDRLPGETDEQLRLRQNEAYNTGFIGAAAISQTILFNEHGTGKLKAGERLDSLMAEGGIQACGNAQNCVAVCPKNIPLTRSIARAGRQTTKRMITRWFDS